MLKYSLKAGSLFYAIAIALVFALISAALILSSYFNRVQISDRVNEHNLQLNAFSGINILLANTDSIPANPTFESRDLYGNGTDSVKLLRKQWGIWELGISKAYSKNKEQVRIALIGGYNTLNSSLALYLADNNKPLSICGKTIIKGNVFLPKAGIKMAYIEGQNFVGDKLVNGEINESKSLLPDINFNILSNNNALYTGIADNKVNGDSIINVSNKYLPDTISNLFSNRTIIVYSTDKIHLSLNKYKGNVIVISLVSILIDNSCKLNDVIMYAPSIKIKDGFTGTLQCFAGDSLMIGKDCTLQYPSSLNLLALKNKVNLNTLVFINDNSLVSGVITANVESNNKIVLAKKAIINGEIYCKGSVELNGVVNGRIYCNRFMLNTSSSVYENHLLNAVIDNSQLSKQFIGIDIKSVDEKSKQGKKGIAKWLN